MKPNCYHCIHRHNISGDAHSSCDKVDAKVSAREHGFRMGWFRWPFNFDPVWLLTCDSFELLEIPKEKTDNG